MAVLKADGVEARLRKHDGNMAAVGRAFGVSRQAVHEFVSKRAALRAVVADCREAMKDEAETSLHKAVKDGEAWAVCFYLKTQAKDRGYIERQEISNVSDRDIEAAVEAELERLRAGGSGPVPGAAANGRATRPTPA